MVVEVKRKIGVMPSSLLGMNFRRSIILIVLACIQSFLLFAETVFYSNDDYDFELIDSSSRTVRIIGGHNLTGEVRLPSRVSVNGKDYTVTSIVDDVILNSSITELVIPNNYLDVVLVPGHNGPLSENNTIKRVIFEDGDTPITTPGYRGTGLFTNTSVEYAYLGRNLEYTYTEGVLSLNYGPFVSSKLKEIEFSNEFTSIPRYFLNGCSSLTSVKLPSKLKTIRSGVFSGCSSLSQINLPESIDSIGEYAFRDCAFVDFKLPDNIKFLGEYAFASNSSLKRISIPKSLPCIPKGAFSRCEVLESIDFPITQDTIFSETFLGCNGLKSIAIPEKISVIEKNAFQGISSERFVFESSNQTLDFKHDALYMARIDSLKIHRPLIFKGPQVFYAKHVIISNMDSIPDSMFASAGLISVVLEEGVEKIGQNTFAHNPEIETVIFPSTLTLVGYNAFWGCINNPSLVICNNPVPPYAKNSAIGSSSARLEVPRGSRRKYVQSSGWNVFGTIWDGLPTKMSLSPEKPQIKIDQTMNLSVAYSPEGTEEPRLIWSSNNPEIADVDDSGKITGKNRGTAIITAISSEDPDLKASITVTVDYNPITSIVLSSHEAIIHLGDKLQLEATVIPEIAVTTPLTWSAYGSISVDQNGLVSTPYNTGEGKIIVSSSIDPAVADTCFIKVIEPLTQSFELSQKALSFELFKKSSPQQLRPVITPNNASKIVKWESSNNEIVEIDEEGIVKPLGIGDAVITAFTTDGSNLKSECAISITPTLVDAVSLSSRIMDMKIGESCSIEAHVIPESAYDHSLEWGVSPENIVNVDENGTVTALAEGEAVIKVTAKDGSGKSAHCRVTVSPIWVEAIDLNPTEWVGGVNEEFQIEASVMPSDATDKSLLWTSSDPDVAIVDDMGFVKTNSIGHAVITATAKDGSNISASCAVSVNPVLVETIDLNPFEWDGGVSEEFQIEASILPSDATDKSLVWTSSDPDVAIVDDLGIVKTRSIGNAVITATAKDGSNISASCTVSVNPVLVDNIEIFPTEWIGTAPDVFQPSISVLPMNATDKTVIWSSSNENVASVDSDGLVTVRAPGEAIIKVTAIDGSGCFGECLVIVNNVLVETIYLTPDSWNGEEGSAFFISAIILPENATDKTILWTSSDDSIANVDAVGNVSVLKAGYCEIVANATDGSNVSAACVISSESGIDEVFFDNDRFDIYDLNGILVKKDGNKNDLKLLLSGIYIIRKGDISKRFIKY